MFKAPPLASLPEAELLRKLGVPETGPVVRHDGKDHDAPEIPKYLVWPASKLIKIPEALGDVQIIDFGESFRSTEPPKRLHTPLPVRAPEIIFEDRIDHRVDLWSLGCMVRDNAAS